MNEVRYLGTMVTPQGIKPDPAKVSAIVEMTSPTDKVGIRRLLGMMNFLAPQRVHYNSTPPKLTFYLGSRTG